MASGSPGVQINYRLTLSPRRVPEAAVPAPHRPIDLKALVSLALMPLQKEAVVQGYPLLTGAATCTEDNIANISSLVRTFMPESAPTQLIGFTTCVNAFQGWWAAKKAKMRFDAASRIHDRGGMIEGGIDTVRGASQSLGGAAYMGSRGAMIAQNLGAVSPFMAAVTPSGWVTQAFGAVGNICFTVFYAMIALWSAFGLRKDLQLGSALKAAKREGDVALFRLLKDRTCADPKKKLSTLTDMQQYKLQKTALDAMSGQFMLVQKRWKEVGQLQGKRPLSASEARELLKEMFAVHDSSLRGSDAWNHYIVSLGLSADDPLLRKCNFSMLELIGFMLEEEKRQCKKEAKFSRVTDGGCVEAVQKAARLGLEQRLVSSEPLVKAAASRELEALQKRVTSENGKTTRIHAILLVIGIIGIVISIAGFLALAHPAVIALVALGALVNIGLMMVTDGYFLKTSLGNGPPGIHDKKYLVAIATLLVIVIGVSLSVTLGFGLPLLPCIAACAVGGIGLMITGYSYHSVVQKEKKWNADHPDLMAFRDILAGKRGQDALDDEVAALFKKLPKADRLLIREKYLEMSRRGEMTFRSPGYLLLDRGHDFGTGYLLLGQESAQAEQQLRVRAIKKTVKSCWKDYEQSRSEQNRLVALRMQALHDSMEKTWGGSCITPFGAKPALLALDLDFAQAVYGQQDMPACEKPNQGPKSSGLASKASYATPSWEESRLRILDIQSIPGAWNALKKNLWYVAKRQENMGDLKRAVAAAMEQRRSLPAAQSIVLASERPLKGRSDASAMSA